MENIQIEIIKTEDAEAYFNLLKRNSGRLKRYFPLTIDEVSDLNSAKAVLADYLEKRKEKKVYPFGIYKDRQLIGWISVKNIDWKLFKGELGYYIDQTQEGHGIMSFVLQQIIPFCFEELNLLKVFLRIGLDNLGSKRLAEKNEFVLEGVLRKEFRIENGSLVDVAYFGLLKNDYATDA